MVGAYVGGPAVNLEETLRTVDGTAMDGVIGYALNGFIQAYPQYAGEINDMFNDAGHEWLAKIANACTPELATTLGEHPTSYYTKTGQPIMDILQTRPELLTMVRAQDLGSVAPKFPVLIQHATNDDVLPYSAARGLAQRWCSMGTDVQFTRYENPSIAPGKGINHLAQTLFGASENTAWMQSRLAGGAPANNCANLPA